MIDPERRARIIAYNRKIKAERDKLDGITALRNSLPKVPTIKEFAEFLRNLDKLIRG